MLGCWLMLLGVGGVGGQTAGCTGDGQYAQELGALNTECCKPPAQCPHGMPSACTAACAFAFFSMDSSGCAAVLEQQLTAPGSEQFAASLATLRCAVVALPTHFLPHN